METLRLEDLSGTKAILPKCFADGTELRVRLARIMRRWVETRMQVTQKDLGEINQIQRAAKRLIKGLGVK